jgi:hypothetical protein
VTVLNTLPVCVLLSYITLLDLNDRINGKLLGVVVLVFFLGFAIGTVQFTGGSDSEGINLWLLVFFQTLAQVGFRILALCSIWMRFKHWGLLATALSWLMVYLFGPQGTAPYWRIVCSESADGIENPLIIAFSRLFVTPLSFFLVMTANYQIDGGKPVTPADSFQSDEFLVWRLLENTVMLASFVFAPSSFAEREPEDFEEWTRNPLNILIVSAAFVVVIIVTWVLIRRQRSELPIEYGPQIDIQSQQL